MPRRIQSLLLSGPAGRIEALLEEPEDGEPSEAALVCHPHPAYGGTMHNKVVHRMARALRRSGSAVLRFNFRGVNLSEGAFNGGLGELEDARAALRWLRSNHPGLPYAVAGFSFGAGIALKLGCEAGAPSRLIAAGLPTAFLPGAAFLSGCAAPKYFIQSTRDEYGPRAALEGFIEHVAPPRELHFVEARDHFFAGALDQFEDAVLRLPRPSPE